MIGCSEIRIARSRAERRTQRLSLRGWVAVPESCDAVEFGSAASLSEALESWADASPGGRARYSRLIMDDSMVQYAMVPGLLDAKTMTDFRTAARLRCEALFGWNEEDWTVAISTPPTSGPVLVCAARRADVAAWELAWRRFARGRPALIPGAIDAIRRERRCIDDDCRLIVTSGETVVGFLVQRGSVAAVLQERVQADTAWDDGSIVSRIDAQVALEDEWRQQSKSVILDTRDWARGAVAREGPTQ